MRSKLFVGFWLLAVLAVLGISAAQAQEGKAVIADPNCCGTCDPGCGACDGCGCCLCGCLPGCPGFIGGAEAVFLKPHFKDNRAVEMVRGPLGGTYFTSAYFGYDYEISPRFWLGWVGQHGFGGRLRYWFFDHASSVESATVAGDVWAVQIPRFPGTVTTVAGDTIAAGSNLRAYTLDAEAMQRAALGHWHVNLGGGLRHLSIAQSYDAIHTDAAGAVLNTLSAYHAFDGFGPTVFAELRRPFRSGGIAFLTNVRGSFLYGDAVVRSDQIGQFGPAARDRQSHEGTTLSVGEIQIGAELSREVGYGTRVVAQLLWEGQYWHGTGNATLTKDDDLGLMGVAINLGIAR